MSTLKIALSPQFPKYNLGALVPSARGGNIVGRLILQDGTQLGKDEYNMDTLSVPFKIFAGSDWYKLLPTRGDTLAGFPNMVVWDPVLTVTVGKVWVELRILLKGLAALNGVNNRYDGFKLNPKPRDATGIASAQISGTDGETTMDAIFYRPQTVYRYVTTTNLVEPPQVVNDAKNRTPRLISFSVRGTATAPDYSGDSPYVVNGFNVGVRQRCSDVNTVQVGNFFQNEATVVYEYYDTANAS